MPTTTFVWDPVNDCVISELDDTGATQAVYTNEPQQYGGVLSQRRGSTSSFLHADALGTTRLLTSTAGATTDTYLFDAWGNPVSSTGSTVNPFRWVGRYGYYTDSITGLIYVRARMYQPSTGRWSSIDPMFYWSLHSFAYAENCPCKVRDPSGLLTCEVFEFDAELELNRGVLKIRKGDDNLAFGVRMKIYAQFVQRGNLPYCCLCCEYRQCVKGTIEVRTCDQSAGDGSKARNCTDWSIKGPNTTQFQEDCKTDDSGIKQCYGHRSNPHPPSDMYPDWLGTEDANVPAGCFYRGTDLPGIVLPSASLEGLIARKRELQMKVQLEFRSRIIDVCRSEKNADPCGNGVIVDAEKLLTLSFVYPIRKV